MLFMGDGEGDELAAQGYGRGEEDGEGGVGIAHIHTAESSYVKWFIQIIYASRLV